MKKGKTITVEIQIEELIKKAQKRLRPNGGPPPTLEEIRKEVRKMIMAGEIEEINRLIEYIKESGRTLEILEGPSLFFADEKIRRELIQNLNERIEREKKVWISSVSSVRKEDLKGKSLKEKILYFINIPLDWYVFNRFFNLLKKVNRELIELCDLNLNQEELEVRLNKLSEELKEVRIFDKVISDYCHLDFSYYQRIKEFLEKKFLRYGDNQAVNEIVKKIKEVI